MASIVDHIERSIANVLKSYERPCSCGAGKCMYCIGGRVLNVDEADENEDFMAMVQEFEFTGVSGELITATEKRCPDLVATCESCGGSSVCSLCNGELIQRPDQDTTIAVVSQVLMGAVAELWEAKQIGQLNDVLDYLVSYSRSIAHLFEPEDVLATAMAMDGRHEEAERLGQMKQERLRAEAEERAKPNKGQLSEEDIAKLLEDNDG